MSQIYTSKLSIVIMAHPFRREMAQSLAESLGGVPIVWDEKNNVWDTCRRSWERIDKTAEYGLVLQDDSIACKDFWKRAESLLTGLFVYNLFVHYIFRAQVKKALSENKTCFFRDNIASEVALCMPTKYIASMLEYCQNHNAKDDTLISIWARQNHIKICYSIPSLVDHRAGESVYLKLRSGLQRKGSHHSCCFADKLNN